MRPLIYFSYGMTKSGSTLAYELARSGLILAGLDQPRLSLAAVQKKPKLNFCAGIDRDRADAIRRETAAIGHMIAIKTHNRPDPEVVRLLQSGEAMAHAVYRDPRDMALSMLDHGVRSRAKGREGFVEFFTLDDTIENLCHQTNSLKSWLSLPNVWPLYYEDVAFDMTATATRMYADMGLATDIPGAMKMAVEDRFTQLNQGRRHRHHQDMSTADSRKFAAIFAGFIDLLITNRAALPRDGTPAIAADAQLCDWSHQKIKEEHP